jgi:hypothetical protein
MEIMSGGKRAETAGEAKPVYNGELFLAFPKSQHAQESRKGRKSQEQKIVKHPKRKAMCDRRRLSAYV